MILLPPEIIDHGELEEGEEDKRWNKVGTPNSTISVSIRVKSGGLYLTCAGSHPNLGRNQSKVS